jgi:hypothetical protein
MWEPRRFTTLWASMACYSDTFTLFFFFYLLEVTYLCCRIWGKFDARIIQAHACRLTLPSSLKTCTSSLWTRWALTDRNLDHGTFSGCRQGRWLVEVDGNMLDTQSNAADRVVFQLEGLTWGEQSLFVQTGMLVNAINGFVVRQRLNERPVDIVLKFFKDGEFPNRVTNKKYFSEAPSLWNRLLSYWS